MSCRLCLTNCSDADFDVTHIEDLYVRLTSYQIKSSDVPQKVCSPCFQLIHQVADFFTETANTEQVLANFNEAIKVEYIEEEETVPVVELTLKEAKELIKTRRDEFVEAPLKLELMQKKADFEKKANKRPGKKPDHLRWKNKMVVCDLCGASMRNSQLVSHQRCQHSSPNAERYICDLCHRDYKHKVDIAKHMKYYHIRADTFPCPICFKVFRIHNTMRAHMRKNHQNKEDYPYSCVTCGKRFIKSCMAVDCFKTHLGNSLQSTKNI